MVTQPCDYERTIRKKLAKMALGGGCEKIVEKHRRKGGCPPGQMENLVLLLYV